MAPVARLHRDLKGGHLLTRSAQDRSAGAQMGNLKLSDLSRRCQLCTVPIVFSQYVSLKKDV